MNAVNRRISLVAGALISLVGCYSNNGGLLYLDSGTGPGPDGGSGGSGGADGGSGGGSGGAGGSAGAGGTGGNAGSGGTGGTGATGGTPLTGTWQPPVVIDSHAGIGVNPLVSISNDGEAVSVWVQSDLGAYKVWANRYTPSDGWEGDLLIGTTDGNAADLTKTSQPYVVVDANGVATAAWADYGDPLVRGLVSRQYTAPDGWGDPGTIYDGASTAGDARLAVDASGNVMAVFATGTGAWANQLEAGVGWGVAGIIDNQPNAPSGVQVALEPNGDGWSVWSQAPTGIAFNIFGNVFTAGTGWGDAGKVEKGTVGNALAPALAVDASGNTLFLWQQTAGLRFQVWWSRWNASTSQLTARIRLDDAGTAYAPAVALSPNGTGTAVWIQSVQGTGLPLQVAASRFTLAGGWSAPETLAEGEITSNPRVATDSQGNAVVVYTQKIVTESQVDAWARTYSAGVWGPAVRLGLDAPIGDAFQPSVSMDPNGNAVVVWREGPDIWASTFE
jgi:hypothetical protein